jgi:phage tail-like protein
MDHPMSGIHFKVEWGGTCIGFSEVSGLEIEVQVIEYRHGASPEYSVRKMPGQVRYSNVILRRGLMPRDNEFFEWFRTIRLNQVERRDMTVSLLNEAHEPEFVWKLRNAFPVKLSGPLLNAKGNEVAIETLEVAHEGLFLEDGKR